MGEGWEQVVLVFRVVGLLLQGFVLGIFFFGGLRVLFVFRLGGGLVWRVLFLGLGLFGCVWSIDGVCPVGV